MNECTDFWVMPSGLLGKILGISHTIKSRQGLSLRERYLEIYKERCYSEYELVNHSALLSRFVSQVHYAYGQGGSTCQDSV